MKSAGRSKRPRKPAGKPRSGSSGKRKKSLGRGQQERESDGRKSILPAIALGMISLLGVAVIAQMIIIMNRTPDPIELAATAEFYQKRLCRGDREFVPPDGRQPKTDRNSGMV